MVHRVHSLEFFALNISHHALELVLSPATSKGHSVAPSYEFSERKRSGLIIYDLAFFFCTLLWGELSPDAAISNCFLSSRDRDGSHTLNNEHADAHHDWVHHSWVSFHWHLSTLRNVAESHQHVSTGDADSIERGPSIIFGLVANLWSEIASFDSRAEFPCVDISSLNHKWLYTMVILIDNQTSENDSMTRETTKISGPVFCSSDTRGVDDEFISVFIESRCCLNTSHVWTMSDLSLSVTSQNIEIRNLGQPSGPLLFVC